jgi:hypothetical protein
MPLEPWPAELHPVAFKITGVPAWFGAIVLAALFGVGVVAITATTTTRQGLLAGLERPARVSGSAGNADPFRAVVSAHGYEVVLTRELNRASAASPVAVRVSRRGRAIAGAQVSITYSMPSMGMWAAYTSRLSPDARVRGRYRAREAVLGMPGAWRLRITVKPQRGAAFSVAVSDRMHG